MIDDAVIAGIVAQAVPGTAVADRFGSAAGGSAGRRMVPMVGFLDAAFLHHRRLVDAVERAVMALSLLLAAGPADALFVLSADDVCAPADDPCVIDEPLVTSSALPLDFGRRTVVVTGDGSFSGGVDLFCGALEVDAPGTWLRVTEDISDTPVRIAVTKGCSTAPESPCFVDADCVEGTCSVGDGRMRLGGSLIAPSQRIELKAAGDVAIAGRIRTASDLPGAAGGRVFVTSTAGSIALTRTLNVNASRHPGEYWPVEAGRVLLEAAGDILLRGRIRAIGFDGFVKAVAGRDLRVESAILLRGRDAELKGGNVALEAGRDLVVASVADRPPARIDLKGGSSYHVAGDGGHGSLVAGGRLDVESGTLLRSDCGRGFVLDDWVTFPGDWTLQADGDMAIDGTVSARGCNGLNPAAVVEISTDGSFFLGPNGTIDLHAAYGARLTLRSGAGEPVVLDGVVDITGFIIPRPNPNDTYGQGGYFEIDGGDVTIDGIVRSGGDRYGGSIFVNACRVHLARSALLDNSLGLQHENGSDATNLFWVGENMSAAPGSAILAAATGKTEIVYRDAAKPPSLLGTTNPPAVLTLAPGLSGCPVCGNSEVDEGEYCDDGNTTAGDGCNGSCQTE